MNNKKMKNRLQLQPRPFWGINFQLSYSRASAGINTVLQLPSCPLWNFLCPNYCANGTFFGTIWIQRICVSCDHSSVAPISRVAAPTSASTTGEAAATKEVGSKVRTPHLPRKTEGGRTPHAQDGQAVNRPHRRLGAASSRAEGLWEDIR